MSFLLVTHYRLAYDSIQENRTRSILTCLGIAIGVAAIILILSLMGSINKLIESQSGVAGPDLLIVRPSTNKDAVTNIVDGLTTSNQYLYSNLRLDDVKTIQKLDNVSAVTPISHLTATISADRQDDNGNSYKSTIDSAEVIATSADIITIQDLHLHSGTFLGETSQVASAIVGHSLSLSLFGTTEPIGKTFTLYNQRFIVTGILDESHSPINFNNINFDNAVLVSASFLASINQPLQIQQIDVRAKTTSSVPQLAESIKTALIESKSGDTNFSVVYGDQISRPNSSLFTIISNMLTLVASISLLVGGIGIMNIMLVSVAERTHEIGIRKAVGAASIHILLQFLFESLILSCLGGALGLILGYGCAFFISMVSPFAPYIDFNILGITLLTSILTGIVFGLYPAIKAARKNPIDSLRYYR